MKRKILLTIVGLIIFTAQNLQSQGKIEDYKRAEKYLHFNIYNLVQNIYIYPHWIGNSSNFWYYKQTDNGFKYVIVNTNKNYSKDCFNHIKLAEKLSQKLNKTVNPDSLPFYNFTYSNNLKNINFKIDTIDYAYDISKNVLKTDTSKRKKYKKNESISPDGKWICFVKNYNLYLRNVESGEESQLTKDGIDHYDYATPLSWYKIVDESVGDKYDPSIDIHWAPNSKKFFATKLDRRASKKLFLYQSLPEEGMRAKVWSYERTLPGDTLPTLEYFIFDVENKTKVKVKMPPIEDIWSGVETSWIENSKQIYFAKMARYYKSIDFSFINSENGNVKNIIHEDAETMIESQMVGCTVLNNGSQVVWLSEKDGWNHLYLWDEKNAKQINQITKGEFVVRNISYVDEEKKEIYFVASGKEKNIDPYFKFLYKINFDGTGLKLLTPEDAEHDVKISPNHKYFIDNFSRVDLKPKTVLRRLSDGKLIRIIEEANIDKLLATGWKYPKRFTTKARDGKTDIYGILQFPSNFDSTKTYPIIDNSYSGPQAVTVPKSFRRGIWNDFTTLAEIGFIIIKVDGLGTAMRSKKFHNYSYMNLGDIGGLDHIAAIKQLAEIHSYIDTNKVGIYGHSAGGYDAAHAMLIFPDFYKVGVAAAGNHDQRMAKSWWPEQYMGKPGKQYIQQSNITLAKNLKGKLLLVHGDMDNNVNPACTFRFAAELVKQNKDFDLIIIPNNNHSDLWGNKYLIRRRMDYFVKYLWNIEPPKEFEFKKY